MPDRNACPDPQNGDSELEAPTEENNTPPNNAVNNNESSLREIKCTLIFLIISVVAHWWDLGNDIWLTYDYFATQKICYGCLTLAFVIIPLIICTYISFRMYIPDDRSTEQPAEEDERSNFTEMKEKLQMMCWIVLLILFQLVLPLRYLRSIPYAWKVRMYQQNGDKDGINEYYRKLLKEQEDSALVNIIECFLESAPQLILQLTNLLRKDEALTTAMRFKIVGGCVTLLALSWSMRTYHCAVRSVQREKPVITYFGSGLLFLWHLGTIASRIFLIGIAVSNWPIYMWWACTFIWSGWTIWLYTEDGIFEFCRDKSNSGSDLRTDKEIIRALLFAAVLAVVYMFTFVNVGKGNARVKISTYYVLYVIENVIVIALWFSYADKTIGQAWFTGQGILILSSMISLVIGIVAMGIFCFTKFAFKATRVEIGSGTPGIRLAPRFRYTMGIYYYRELAFKATGRVEIDSGTPGRYISNPEDAPTSQVLHEQ